MTWFKVDDSLHAHKKAMRAGVEAMGLWVLAGSWSADQLTDGWVPEYAVGRWAANADDLASKLVSAGLWTPGEYDGDKGWWFHEWDERQPSRTEVQEKRKNDAERRARWREAKARNEAARKAEREQADAESQRASQGVSQRDNTRDSQRDNTCDTPRESQQVSQRESALPDPTRPDPTRALLPTEEGVELLAPDADAPGAQLVVFQGGAQPARQTTNARDAVAAWTDAYHASHDAEPTRRALNQVGREAKALLDAHNPPDRVLRAAQAAGAKGYATVEREYRTLAARQPATTSRQTRAATTDLRVAQGQALIARYEQESS